jgi:hypothetical protein
LPPRLCTVDVTPEIRASWDPGRSDSVAHSHRPSARRAGHLLAIFADRGAGVLRDPIHSRQYYGRLDFHSLVAG